MLDTRRIAQTAAQPTAIIRITIPREEIRNVIGSGYGELMAAVPRCPAIGVVWLRHNN